MKNLCGNKCKKLHKLHVIFLPGKFRFDGESHSASTGFQTPDGGIKTTSTWSASLITKGKNVKKRK